MGTASRRGSSSPCRPYWSRRTFSSGSSLTLGLRDRSAWASGDRTEPIGEYELASRLSYFLWSTMPDEELFRLAGEGKLHVPEVLSGQVRRMLLDPRARAIVENFAGQWLQIRNLRVVNPDRDRFPGFDEPLREAMLRETELFFDEVMRRDRSILDFLDADFTYVNERWRALRIGGDLGRGVPPGPPGWPAPGRTVDPGQHPDRDLESESDLAGEARARWVLEQILGTPPPPPPPDVSTLKEEHVADWSVAPPADGAAPRQTSCAVCHNRLDPLGFGLENYDGVGAWREQEAGQPVDASGTLPSGESFRGPGELKARSRPPAHRLPAAWPRRC